MCLSLLILTFSFKTKLSYLEQPTAHLIFREEVGIIQSFILDFSLGRLA